MPDVLSLPVPYEELDHTADVGLRVHGPTPEQCLGRLALGLSAITLGGSEELTAHPLKPESTRALEVSGEDRATIAVNLLRELLYVFDTEHCLPATCVVHRFDGDGAMLEFGMAPFDEDVYEDVTDLKAVTWHGARFEAVSDGWLAEIIFDI